MANPIMMISEEAMKSLEKIGYCVVELIHDEPEIGEKFEARCGDVRVTDAVVISVHISNRSPFVRLAVLQKIYDVDSIIVNSIRSKLDWNDPNKKDANYSLLISEYNRRIRLSVNDDTPLTYIKDFMKLFNVPDHLREELWYRFEEDGLFEKIADLLHKAEHPYRI
jgi:hypothetical protein